MKEMTHELMNRMIEDGLCEMVYDVSRSGLVHLLWLSCGVTTVVQLVD